MAEPLSAADRASLAAERGPVNMAVGAALLFDDGPGVEPGAVLERLDGRLHLLGATPPAERVVQQCVKLGFDGPIWPVHPKRTHLAGVPCLPSLDALPGVPDSVFLGVNRHTTVEAIATLRSIGAGGAVCYGSGFAETGDARLQQDLLDAAGGMPFLGPNCYGIVNALDRVALWPDEHGMKPLDRGVAIVSQSGNVAVNVTFQQRGLPLAAVVSVGNQASVGMEDCVDAFLDDPRITAVGLFLEAIRDAQRFAVVARRAHDQGIPIVALHTGRSATGAAIATSHTGSMSGHAAAYDALFARYGVATVETPAQRIELAEHALIPGLVNAHTHNPMTLMRGLADDLPLMRWLQEHIWPAEAKAISPEFVRDGVELAIAEMLRGGTTCCSENYFFPDVQAATYRRLGFRAMVALPIIEFPSAWAKSRDEYFDKGLAVHDEFRGEPLIGTSLGPHAPYTVADASFERIRVLADQPLAAPTALFAFCEMSKNPLARASCSSACSRDRPAAVLPDLKSASAASRSAWVLSPWIASAWMRSRRSWCARRFAPMRVPVKTSTCFKPRVWMI